MTTRTGPGRAAPCSEKMPLAAHTCSVVAAMVAVGADDVVGALFAQIILAESVSSTRATASMGVLPEGEDARCRHQKP